MRYSPSREPGTCILCHSIYLQAIKSTDLNYSINRFSYVHSPRTTDESLNYPVNIVLMRHLVRSDFFAKIYTNFEIHRRVPRVKISGEIQKEHTHHDLSLPPSLSLSTCRSADGMFTLMSLSLHLQTRFRSRSDPNGNQNRFKNVCIW